MKETYRCEYVNCGKCRSSCAHGPYWYAYHKEEGKTRKRYIGKKDPRPRPEPSRGRVQDAEEGYKGYFEPIFSERTATLDLAWEILQVPRNSRIETCKAAYRKLSLEHHPDRGGQSRMFKYVHAAWSYLKARHGW